MISIKFRFLSVLLVIFCTTSIVSAFDYEETKKKAENGNLASQIELADYFYTELLFLNYKLAFKWYSAAAKQGDEKSDFRVGLLMFRGDGVAQDQAGSLVIFRRLVKKKYPKAINVLGYMYEKA